MEEGWEGEDRISGPQTEEAWKEQRAHLKEGEEEEYDDADYLSSGEAEQVVQHFAECLL